jgi:hypothetical protein
MKTIFVTISSYRDPFLETTVNELFSKAKHKERLVVGIVDQSYSNETFELNKFPDHKHQIRYFRIDPEHARGACWARSVGMSMYNGEDYFFQIDAHTIFKQDWDEYFINQIEELETWHEKPLITTYPCAFQVNNKDIKDLTFHDIEGVIALAADEKLAFNSEGDDYVGCSIHTLGMETPVHGFMISANCLFAPGRFVNEVPYDPVLFFSGEEHSLALRAWTSGWNIFYTPNVPMYHCYEREYRITVWTDNTTEDRKQIKWWERDVISKQRLTKVIRGEDLGIYGIGKQRSLADYIKWTGIDYLNRYLEDKAKNGMHIFQMDYRKPVIVR